MSDDQTDEDEHPQDNPNLRQLREKAKRADDAEHRAQAAERELAFAKAGVDLNDPRTGYFVRGYDGEATPDAIRAAAERDGFLNTQPEPKPAVTPEEQAAIQRVSAATEGAETPPPTDYMTDFRALRERAERDHLSPEQFAMEVTKTVDKLGGAVELDGYPFVPPSW